MMNEQKTAPATLDDAIQSIDALEAADETRLKSYAESKIKSVESFRALPLIVGAFSLSAAAAYFVMKQIQPQTDRVQSKPATPPC